ncbi:hypothetical protein BV22DRAFT_894482 [Leucogyrophana mollusca]|uniref:Uncharacterized protein n=1 Tax=Leucogyrophana mollusca TaxID=85980 RepID=A0ACB8B025_9AGAM|nr:hypothetical protein BV22DRAFT_894482 [Leucogyrophana mollusca]
MQARKAKSTSPIIIISSSPTALITMHNVKRFLQESVFEPSAAARARSGAQGGGRGEHLVTVDRAVVLALLVLFLPPFRRGQRWRWWDRRRKWGRRQRTKTALLHNRLHRGPRKARRCGRRVGARRLRDDNRPGVAVPLV